MVLPSGPTARTSFWHQVSASFPFHHKRKWSLTFETFSVNTCLHCKYLLNIDDAINFLPILSESSLLFSFLFQLKISQWHKIHPNSSMAFSDVMILGEGNQSSGEAALSKGVPFKRSKPWLPNKTTIGGGASTLFQDGNLPDWTIPEWAYTTAT